MVHRLLTINGWAILGHPLFLQQVETLAKEVECMRETDPLNYHLKNASKKLAAIAKLSFEKIPSNPSASEYRQGSTLGSHQKHWFRAKFFQQYRLFFRYHQDSKIIVYAWVNDDSTKRAYGSQTDAYLVFKKMLKNGHPPDGWDALLKEAGDPSSIKKLNKVLDGIKN
jgi:toxin YhaV